MCVCMHLILVDYVYMCVCRVAADDETAGVCSDQLCISQHQPCGQNYFQGVKVLLELQGSMHMPVSMISGLSVWLFRLI
jgi:hypothetical protein